MRIIGITALLATALIGGCKNEQRKSNVPGQNLVGTRNSGNTRESQVERTDSRNTRESKVESTDSGNTRESLVSRVQDNKQPLEKKVVVEDAPIRSLDHRLLETGKESQDLPLMENVGRSGHDYSALFSDLDMDENMKEDFNIEMAKVDEVFKTEMKTWGLDVAALRSMLEKESAEIGADFPAVKNEAWATAAKWSEVLELAVGGKGITAVLQAYMEADDKLIQFENAARAAGLADKVDPRLDDAMDLFHQAIDANPKTRDVIANIGRQIIDGVDQLNRSYPELAADLRSQVQAFM